MSPLARRSGRAAWGGQGQALAIAIAAGCALKGMHLQCVLKHWLTTHRSAYLLTSTTDPTARILFFPILSLRLLLHAARGWPQALCLSHTSPSRDHKPSCPPPPLHHVHRAPPLILQGELLLPLTVRQPNRSKPSHSHNCAVRP